jgi:hypothetical protein
MNVATREPYFRQAARAFLDGLPYQSPAEAVEAGARDITAWCVCLEKARTESEEVSGTQERSNLLLGLLSARPRTVKELSEIMQMGTQGVSKLARDLMSLGLIRYGSGHVLMILDPNEDAA